jgi:hypothetical protein
MLWRMILGLSLLLTLAACGGQASPTLPAATTAGDAAASTPTTSNVVVVTRPPRDTTAGSLPVEPPGTLVAAETEDPTAGQPFIQLQLVRVRGGEQASRDELLINGDGSFTYNGRFGTATAGQLERINLLIDSVNFFGLQGNMLGPVVENSGTYQYGLTITRATTSRTIASMDGFMPQEYLQLLGASLDVTNNLPPITPTVAPS